MMTGLASDSPMFGLRYAVAAYVLIFAATFGYVAWLHVVHARLRRRLERLEREAAGGQR
jgi:CcmD family protein